MFVVLCEILLVKTHSDSYLFNTEHHTKTGWSTSEKTNTAISTHVPFSLPQIFLQALSVTFSGGAHLPGLGKNSLQIPQEGFSMALPPALQLLLFLFLSFLAFFFRGD